MKRVLATLLALAIGLSACTPAKSKTEETFNSAVENAQTPENSTEQSTLPTVGDLTLNGYLLEGEGGFCYVGVWDDQATGEARWALFRLDYATGQRQLLQTFDLYRNSMNPSEVLVRDGRVYCATDSTIYCLSLDGSERKTIPRQGTGYWLLSDENACYTLGGNVFSGVPRPSVQRTDLQTGAVTSWELPAMNLIEVCGSRGSRVLAARYVTDQPIPSMEDSELFNMVLQNAIMEFGWLDLNTGDWQGILSCPNSGQENGQSGQTVQWAYIGMNGDALYFQRAVIEAGDNILSTTLERCAPDGSGMTEVLKLPSDRSLYPVCRGADLVWLMDYTYSDRATVYDLENGKTYENIPVQPDDSGNPVELTEDGRVLVNDHYTQWGDCIYAILDVDDYLAGSRDWTVFADAEN